MRSCQSRGVADSEPTRTDVSDHDDSESSLHLDGPGIGKPTGIGDLPVGIRHASAQAHTVTRDDNMPAS